MKKIISLSILSLFLITLFSLSVNALTCTLNNPTDKQYDNGVIMLNVSTVRSTDENVTNVTWTIGTSVFVNDTINGTNSSSTTGDFTYTLVASDLADGSFTAYASCYNSTLNADHHANVSTNSTSITYTVDTINPAISLNKPNKGQKVAIKGGGDIKFKYTPTETNLGNSTLYLDGKAVKSSTSVTTVPNITSGEVNEFSYFFKGNNNSVTFIIELTDLAGLKTNSSTYTFSVFTDGSIPKEKIIDRGGQPLPSQPVTQKPFAVGEGVGSFVGRWWWAIAIVIAVAGFIYWKEKKK